MKLKDNLTDLIFVLLLICLGVIKEDLMVHPNPTDSTYVIYGNYDGSKNILNLQKKACRNTVKAQIEVYKIIPDTNKQME